MGICTADQELRWKHQVSSLYPTEYAHGFVVCCFAFLVPWWRHQMETFSALLTLCAGNSQVTGEFPTQRPVTRSFGIFFDLRLNKRLSKQSWGWWFATTLRSLWRHSNPYMRQLNGSVSIQVMDCRLFGAKRLPETILTCYQLGPW